MRRGGRRPLKRLLMLAVPAVAVAAAPWHMALLAVVAAAAILVLVAWRAHGRARGRAVFLAVLAIAALTAGRQAFDASHIGAPIGAWTASYHCPARRQTLSTNDWVKAPNPNVQYYYNGWQDLIGCEESLVLTTGAR